MRVVSRSPRTTRALGGLFAKELMARPLRFRHATVVTLEGPLGAGKTTFVQALARAAGIRRNLPSPTFTFVRRYPLKRNYYRNLFHIDAFRVRNASARTLTPLGLIEAMENPENLVLVEWPERIARVVPRNAIRVVFRHGKTEEERDIQFTA